jgi:hypothetical protein
MQSLWQEAGLVDLATHEITVQRAFADFDTWWKIARTGPRLAPVLAAMAPHQLRALEGALRERLRPAADGCVTCGARANAIQGRVG